MNFREKILSAESLVPWRQRLRQTGQAGGYNGVFDLLHVGHAAYLQAARNLGDALLVGVTCDDGVRKLNKGPGRPLNNGEDRAALLAALESVSAVYVFPETTAMKFLETVRPDVYVKGGDYTMDTINQDERRLMEQMGARIVILPGASGKSTTALVQKMQET